MMRPMRATKEKLPSAWAPTPRRITRSNTFARFAHTPSPPPLLPTAVKLEQVNGDSRTPDIEDSVPAPARKRRKVDAPTASPGRKPVKAEPAQDTKPAKPPPAARRARKPARNVVDPSTGEKGVEAPSDWEEMYDVVRRMRQPGGAAHGAAVDTMGCERLADRTASPRDQRFHTLIALMLSSQTKDTVNAVVMARLKTELPPHEEGAPAGLNLENILAVDPEVLNEMIWAVGFHNNKTKYIKKAAEIIRDEWNGDIPDTIEGLTSLPGVGPKMGYLCLSVAWDRTEGIGVDVHVHRITNLWGWNRTGSPEETRRALESWLPRDRWREINHMLVGLGQAVCLPQGRRCGDCELGLRGLCRAADRKKVLEGRRIRSEKKDDPEEHVVKKEEEAVADS